MPPVCIDVGHPDSNSTATESCKKHAHENSSMGGVILHTAFDPTPSKGPVHITCPSHDSLVLPST